MGIYGAMTNTDGWYKAQGAAFRTRASVNIADFEFLSGEDRLTFYELSPGEFRWFCRRCGAVIITRFDNTPGSYGFALGTLDTDPHIEIQCDIFTKDKASWFDITDDRPEFEGMPPGRTYSKRR